PDSESCAFFGHRMMPVPSISPTVGACNPATIGLWYRQYEATAWPITNPLLTTILPISRWARGCSEKVDIVFSVRQESVNVHSGARTHIDFAIGYRRGDEFHGVSCAVAIIWGHGTVPVFQCEIGRVVSMQDRWAGARSWHRNYRTKDAG